LTTLGLTTFFSERERRTCRVGGIATYEKLFEHLGCGGYVESGHWFEIRTYRDEVIEDLILTNDTPVRFYRMRRLL
jgi:hypothetical protein